MSDKFIEALKTEAKHVEHFLAIAIDREKSALTPVVKAQAAQARQDLEARSADLISALKESGVKNIEKAVVSDVKTDLSKDVTVAEKAAK